MGLAGQSSFWKGVVVPAAGFIAFFHKYL